MATFHRAPWVRLWLVSNRKSRTKPPRYGRGNRDREQTAFVAAWALRLRYSRLKTRRAWQCVALVIALLVSPLSAFAEPDSALIARARRLDIADSRAWQRLLHYLPGESDELESQVDGREFFLSSSGDHDAEAELEATLTAFLLPVVPGREDEHALCRFPARRRFLDERLHFERGLRAPSCPALARFMRDLDPESVAIVYAANFLSNPASAFGHTFLRIDKRRPAGSTASRDGLAHGVEYIANTDTANPLLYTIKGLTGGFPGVFRFHSFESKIHEYANGEARDLWEYQLDLTPAEAQLLGLHLWELSNTHLDYYYMSKNCSYHALATVEAAAPRIDLIEHLNFVVLPRDTVKALFTVPGLVRGIAYHPSLRSQIRAQVVRLSREQKALVDELVERPDAPLDSDLSLTERVVTLDTAMLVLDARFARSLESSPEPRVAAARNRLLARRRQLSTTVPGPATIPPPYDKAPERAHGSMRLTLGSGMTSQYENSFGTLGYRLALHDLTDPPNGEPELSQLQFLDTRFRYDFARRELTLERLTFAELLALTPLTRYERTLSWRVRAFGMRLHDRACRDCFAHGLNLSLGGTLASENQRIAVFAMADGFVAFSPSVDGIRGSFVRLGVGPYAGVRVRFPGDTVALITASWSYLPWQSLRATYDVRATVRSALAKNVALGLEGVAQPSSSELLFASYLYF